MSGKSSEGPPKTRRQLRLEEQLRENLKKRKEQARARRQDAAAAAGSRPDRADATEAEEPD